jgi:P4 family phage/plasmid primase-like protien
MAELSPASRAKRYLAQFIFNLTGDARSLVYFATMEHGVTANLKSYPPCTIDAVFDKLWDDNMAGRSVYFCPNHLHKTATRHRDDKVTTIHALLADQDTGERIAWPMEPSITVETSPGRYQVYWRTLDCDVTHAREYNRRIAETYATDPAVINPATLMRVPGFRNHKHAGSPWVKIIATHHPENRFLPAGIMNGLRCDSSVPVPTAARRAARALTDDDTVSVRKLCQAFLRAAPQPHEGERNTTIKNVLFKLGDLGASEQTALELVRGWEIDPLPLEELVRLVRGIYRARANDIGCSYVPADAPVATCDKSDRSDRAGEKVFSPTLQSGKLLTHSERSEMFLAFMGGNIIATPNRVLYLYDTEAGLWVQRSSAWLVDKLGRIGLASNHSDASGLASWITNAIESQENPFERVAHGVPFRNMFVELSYTGESSPRPHCREDFLRNLLAIDYRPQDDCPIFKQFLSDWWRGDDDAEIKKEAVARYVGACMAGRGSATQVCMLLLGGGGSGKSTLLKAISKLFTEGPHGSLVSLNPERWGGNANKFALEGLDGRLLNVVSELGVKKFRTTDYFKQVTSGDHCSYEIKNKQGTVVFRPVCGHIFASNRTPEVDDTTSGFWRRWLVIKFNGSFAGQDNAATTSKIDGQVTSELSGIANYFLAAYSRMARQGLVYPPSHRKEIESWAKANHADTPSTPRQLGLA